MSVSVVIPTHNVERWVEESLQSVRAQTRQPDEVIVVDDRSTDQTVKLVKLTGVPTTILHVECSNAAATRNVGVAAARGDYVAFLDADDLWLPEHLERFGQASAPGDVGYFAHHHGFFDGTGKVDQRRPLRQLPGSSLTSQNLIDFFVGPNHGWPTSGMVVDRRRFLAVGGFDETQIRRHDAEMFLRLVHNHTWSYNPEALWRYRLAREGNISGDSLECSMYLLTALKKIQALYKDERLTAMIQRQSRKVLSYAIKSGDARQRTRARTLALNDLNPLMHLLYACSFSVPGLAGAALRVKSRFA